MIAICTLSFSHKDVEANNDDTKFERALREGEDTIHTGFREKENNTGVYIYCDRAINPFVAQVDGGYSSDSYIDCSRGYRYYVKEVEKRYMYNYVYENSFPLASIRKVIGDKEINEAISLDKFELVI